MTRTPNLQLRRLLDDARWTMEQLARSVNALASHEGTSLHYDRTSVAHWLRGTRPRDPTPRLIAAALGIRLNRALTLSDVGLAAPPASGPAASSLIEDLLKTCAPPPAHAEQHPAPSVHTSSSGQRGTTAPTPREATAAFFIHLHYRYGSHGSSALTTYITDEGPRDTSPASLTDSAKLAYTLGLLVADRAEPGRADTLWQHTIRLAQHAGSPDLQSIALRARAALAHRRGQHITSLSLADEARRYAQAPATQAYSVIMSASILAAIHNAKAARRALDRAQSLYQAPGALDDPFTTYPEAGFLFQQAHVLADCGHRQEAIAVLNESLELRPAAELRNRALTHVRLAQLLLPSSAAAATPHLNALLDLGLPGQLRSDAVQDALRGLVRSVRNEPLTQRNAQLHRWVARLALPAR
ncbi:hypothetical protein [Streptomyces sp. cg35]|uniref:hypothetical protein n=1 Tax=Streptomyces sp. cg35 TaxID=3421650 RepID=UPI003D1743E1